MYNNRALLKKIQQLPRSPGVYILKDKDAIPIYIGKARCLRSRVRSHVQKHDAPFNPIRQALLADIVDVEVEQSESEIEALILESALIKKLKPRYNIMLRDDKQYFYVGFTKERFPKVFLTHQPKKLKAHWMGPFVSGGALKATLRFLRKLFPYCTCRRLHKSEKACLNYNIGLDPGYCCVKTQNALCPRGQCCEGRVRKVKNYKRTIQNMRKILRGQKANVVRLLEKEMQKAAKSQEFERAAELRNQLEGLENVIAHKKVLQASEEGRIKKMPRVSRFTLEGISRIEGYDISDIQGRFAVGSMVVIERGKRGEFVLKKSDYRRFKIKTIHQANDPAMLHEVLKRRLRHQEWPLPHLILVDGGASQRNAVLRVLKEVGKPLPVVALAKQEEQLYTFKGKMKLDEVEREEARTLALLRDEAHRFAIWYYRKLHQKALTRD